MGIAVELFFDSEAEQKILRVWDALSTTGISSTMLDIGSRPHISLAVWDSVDLSELQPRLTTFAHDIKSFTIELNSIGSFPSSGAVYLAPEPLNLMHSIHASFHSHIQTLSHSLWNYYLPGQWVPHCALAVDLTSELVSRAIELCQNVHKPIHARVEQIGVVEFRPVKHLLTYQLAQ